MSMAVWCVLVLYSIGSWMKLKSGTPLWSKDRPTELEAEFDFS